MTTDRVRATKHDRVSKNKVIDASIEEVSKLKAVTGLVELELKQSGSDAKTVYVTKSELAKVVPDEVLKKADNARGRRTGFRPNGNGG